MVKSPKKTKRPPKAASERMPPPKSGVRVRMYRPGHGDCFLLAFRDGDGKPYYVLIDCGYKPGSTVHAPIRDIVGHIGASTGNKLDLAVVTHEHQDHVNGIGAAFDPFEIRKAWFAWTEDPHDELADDLRRRHRDHLLGLIGVRNRLMAAGGDPTALGRIDGLLALEIGGDVTDARIALEAAAKDPANSANKKSMALIKKKAKERDGVDYIRPHEQILSLPGVPNIRVFALGPPRDPNMLSDEDPRGSEAFPGEGNSLSAASLYAAVGDAGRYAALHERPFRPVFSIPIEDASGPSEDPFFAEHYGFAAIQAIDDDRIADGAPFRRIDREWLYSGEELALQLNKGINNTSLVLAFELARSKKVLLFVGDAQRGNWMSWTKGSWQDGSRTITARDLLARTVLYKVGHHASHNATLNGTKDDDYPNLGWMAQAAAADEFTAMITAVPAWAYAQRPIWAHPQAAIKEELVKRTSGRLFQTDTDELVKPDGVSQADWSAFMKRVIVTDEYFELCVLDE